MSAENARIVLIPVDDSKHAENAFDWYMNNVFHGNDSLILVHCHEIHHSVTPHAMDTGEWANLVGVQEEKIKALQKKYINKVEEANEKLKPVKLSAEIKVFGGKAGEAICQAALEEHADLIVMGSRGLGVIRRTILGSISDYVLHHSHKPVIICPTVKD